MPRPKGAAGAMSRLPDGKTIRPACSGRRGGFSLIELLIVVAMLGALSAIAVPSFLGYIKRAKKTELIKLVYSFYGMAEDCLVFSSLKAADCDSKLKLGLNRCGSCSSPLAGPSSTAPPDTVSVLLRLNELEACASYRKLPKTPGAAAEARNLFMEGVCHESSGQAAFPIKLCSDDSSCSPGSCFQGSFSLNAANKACEAAP